MPCTVHLPDSAQYSFQNTLLKEIKLGRAYKSQEFVDELESVVDGNAKLGEQDCLLLQLSKLVGGSDSEMTDLVVNVMGSIQQNSGSVWHGAQRSGLWSEMLDARTLSFFVAELLPNSSAADWDALGASLSKVDQADVAVQLMEKMVAMEEPFILHESLRTGTLEKQAKILESLDANTLQALSHSEFDANRLHDRGEKLELSLADCDGIEQLSAAAWMVLTDVSADFNPFIAGIDLMGTHAVVQGRTLNMAQLIDYTKLSESPLSDFASQIKVRAFAMANSALAHDVLKEIGGSHARP